MLDFPQIRTLVMHKLLLAGLLLAASGLAGAQTAPRAQILTTPIFQEPYSSCATAEVGDCGQCSVACPVGQSASCKPGKTGAAGCTREPVCACSDTTAAMPKAK